MTELPTAAPATHLLRATDKHGALLADFDHYPTLELLHVRWHGHLTADALVQGIQAGMQLLESQPLPRRLLSNHRQVTGEWADALPWLQYEWLPAVCTRGVQVLAHVLAPSTPSQLGSYPGGDEFIAAAAQVLRTASFRHLGPAWQWLSHR